MIANGAPGLAGRSRFAHWPRDRARLGLAALVLLIGLCLLALRVPDASAVGPSPDGQTDLMLYEKVVAGMRNGGDYYLAATDAMRAGHYPLRPFFTVRMPTLAALLAGSPPVLGNALLIGLAALTGIAWGMRLFEQVAGTAGRLAVVVLLAGSMLAFVQPELVALHEIWAGLLVALSLALRRPGRWIESAAIALAAMLVRETALLYALVMLGFAVRDHAWREAMGWGVSIMLFGIALAAHAVAVMRITGPLDPVSPGWTGMLGFGFFVDSLRLATALQLLWQGAAAPLVGLALFGWASRTDALSTRVLALFVAYGALIALFARLDTFYWALMVAPMLLGGLVFAPDALRDLTARALDKRRITVTRVTR